MELNFSRWIFDHWQRKGVALLTALILWIFVNNSITDTKTIPNIAVKVINLPSDKAILGLLPNGLLSRRITLTLSGTKDVINDLEAGDVEVFLDATAADGGDEWVVDVTKKNLVSLNPAVNLAQHITQVDHGDFVIKLSRLVTAQVPVTVLPPVGEAPAGYSFIDIWPQRLFQTLSGPEEEIAQIQVKGLRYEFDLSQVSKADLEQAKGMHGTADGSQQGGEVVFFIPNKWKKIHIPVQEGTEAEFNDADAKYLHVTFLQQQWLPIATPIPVQVYYPVKTLDSLNPRTHPLVDGTKIKSEQGVALLDAPLAVYGLSQLFLNQVKNSFEIAIVAASPQERQLLQWSLDVINTAELENTYVALLLAQEQAAYGPAGGGRRREQVLRQRFRNYLQRLTLYLRPEQKLYLECTLQADKIEVK